jgi:hypothetical protein
MDRRAFLHKAGLGSLAVASLPALTTAAWADGGQTNFHFVALSQAPPVGGVVPRTNMSGTGQVNPSRVVGQGSFNIFDNASPVPRTLLAFGTWKAKRLLTFDLIGAYGALAAGVLGVEVHLVREFPSPAVLPATLQIICNLGAAGLSTGQPEGFTLSIPDSPYGPFVPLHPEMGITIFTVLVEQRD